MIHREDMLELTRRMNLSRSCLDRIAGAYLDGEGYVDGTFNRNFLRLTPSERKKNMEMAKSVLFSRTNEQLKDYQAGNSFGETGEVRRLLDGILDSGMKNDALLDIFYELTGERLRTGSPFFCFFFHGSYDVPTKGKDGEWLEGSEEVYEYLICVIGPLAGEYEPGKPEYGFLYPAFRDRSGDFEFINIFERLPQRPHRELTEWLTGKPVLR